jgi:hypothetical protein
MALSHLDRRSRRRILGKGAGELRLRWSRAMEAPLAALQPEVAPPLTKITKWQSDHHSPKKKKRKEEEGNWERKGASLVLVKGPCRRNWPRWSPGWPPLALSLACSQVRQDYHVIHKGRPNSMYVELGRLNSHQQRCHLDMCVMRPA